MAVFGGQALPQRSTLSRFLAGLDQASVEGLGVLFVEDLLARPMSSEQPGGWWDRRGATGRSLRWTGRAALLGKGLCPKGLTYRKRHEAWIRSVRQGIWDAKAARCCEHGRRFCTATRTSG
jgi:hypothetical protein